MYSECTLNVLQLQVIELPCHVPDSSTLQEHHIKILEFTERCDRALQKSLSRGQYEELLKESRKLEIDLPHIQQLKQVFAAKTDIWRF